MQIQDFNAESKPAVYGYVPSPVNERAFLIVRKDEDKGEERPVGDYTVLDQEEDLSLTEKKVMNLVSLLNGRKKLMQLGHETQSRVLYHILDKDDQENRAQVLFYKLEQQGVSKENALFRIEYDREVFDAQ